YIIHRSYVNMSIKVTLLSSGEFLFCTIILYWSSTDNGLVFSGKISNAPFANVLKLWRHETLQSPNSREKSESRRYFDYCGIITTEYKWTTLILKSNK
ncbi:MAG TPA: hypothetical protein VFD03_01285, partial [Clostridia bacterium]|nr:hypothetical protein [Clostridia bacterium]